MTEPSLVDSSTMSSSRSRRLPLIAAIRSPDGDGSIDSTLRVARLLRIRREVAAVVGRPLLVAERLEALLEIAVELLIPFVGVHVERFLERVRRRRR